MHFSIIRPAIVFRQFAGVDFIAMSDIIVFLRFFVV